MSKPKKRSKSAAQVPPLPALDARQRYTVEEASALLRQSRAKTFADIRFGLIRPLKDGTRTYITGEQIIARSTLPPEAQAMSG